MQYDFSNRILNSKKSFIREILKVTTNPDVISFAGGLPNPATFPVEEIRAASDKVLREAGAAALQYSTTEGFLPLREAIAQNYKDKKGLDVSPDEILITSGSQQGLDLIGKVLINQGDDVLIERPGYLGAIQALSSFEPVFHSVALNENGIDVDALETALAAHRPKLLYTVPNFQNPSGITYSKQTREAAANVLKKSRTVLVEDDPYGELRFLGEDEPSFRAFLGDQAVLLGSFSKIVAPGLRLGWVCAGHEIMEKLIVAKQASDLHTNYFAQHVVYEYLAQNDLDAHIRMIREMYGAQREVMVSAIEEHFPKNVPFTRPEGGMFLWATLPEGCAATALFERAIQHNVAFVPGDPFYADDTQARTLRLNYTNSDEGAIRSGIATLGGIIKDYLAEI